MSNFQLQKRKIKKKSNKNEYNLIICQHFTHVVYTVYLDMWTVINVNINLYYKILNLVFWLKNFFLINCNSFK